MSIPKKYEDLIVVQKPEKYIEYESMLAAVEDQYEIYCREYESFFNDKLERAVSFEDKLAYIFRGYFYEWTKENLSPAHWCYFFIGNDKVLVGIR